MRIRRLLAALLTAVLVAQLVPQTALAEVAQSGDTGRTYTYVAIGDSVAAGTALEPSASPWELERSTIMTEERIANPIKTAYPSVFGDKLSELGNKYGVATSALNLGTTAYTANEVALTIREEGYKGAYMSMLLGAGFGEWDRSAPLDEYHGIFNKYLPEADLVSVQLGGNDLWMGPILPLMQSSNPVIQIYASVLSSVLGGQPITSMREYVKMMLEYYQDQITDEAKLEAAQTMLRMVLNLGDTVEDAAAGVEDTVAAIKELNPDADIAILSFYNPYNDATSLEELRNKIETTFTELNEALSEDAASESEESSALNDFAEQLASKLVLDFIGTSLNPLIRSFNRELKQVASRQGATYVDLMNIETGDDSEPHPPAEGHKQIADRMWDALGDQIAAEMAADPQPEPQPGPKTLSVSYAGHQQTYGDLAAVADGATLGHVGNSKRLESVSVAVSGVEGASVSYRSHVQGIGWTGWSRDGESCGTTGQSKRVEALQMSLSGADGWHIWYRVHSQTYGWLGWAKDGEAAGTAGQSKRIEAIEVCVLRDGETPSGYVKGQASFVGYAIGDAHVQGIGWTGAAPVGTLGTVGEGRRIEAFKLNLANLPLSGGIEYEAHVQGIGWQGYKADGEVAGTTGQSKRVEALRVRLTGAMADSSAYSVWYRVHSQTYGWLGWAKDGESAGTGGLSRRAEAIEVQVLPAGQVPAGYDASKDAFVQG